MLPSRRHRDYEIIFNDLEFVFSKEQLNRIKIYHNDGLGIEEISQKEQRNEYEILLAIVHLHRQRRIKEKLYWRD